MTSSDQQLSTRPCLHLEIRVGSPIEIGDVGAGSRRCIPLMGGHFSGDIAGEVLPGGTDWQTVLADGTLEISAHYALRTHEGETLELSSSGVRHASKAVLSRLARGERVAKDEYYFRTHMRLRTAAARLLRFNMLLALGVGERLPAEVRLTVFEVL